MGQEIQVLIDAEKCTGCGLCVADCPRRVLVMRDNKAAIDATKQCFSCGHCFAVCPALAVKLGGLDDEVVELPGKPFLDETDLKTHLKCRRSIRHFKKTPAEREKIEKVIEAGRLTPTGSNSQNVRFIVIQNEIETIEDVVIAQYTTLSELAAQSGNLVMLPSGFDADRLTRGFLFHRAPLAILCVSPREDNACLAAMSMELMAEALGLGVVYVGLFTNPANRNVKLRESLAIKKEERIAACLAIGYPDVQYLRTAPKRAANITWR
uniref:Nitroreductase:4Fe-4S ferredoxin n=1 Tax=uncultured bacterium contig00013 TaxID=1181504 RepID=A0A806KJG0_9BACT|nr:nitroreductase:4Fe-4S ferredoxin [uncultured bacterium contig00013]